MDGFCLLYLHSNKCRLQLGHTIAPNCSPNTRYTVYFRVNLREDGKHHPEPMMNIWLDWSGMTHIVSAEKKFQQSLLSKLDSEEKMKPAYADELKREELKKLEQKDKEIAELKKVKVFC